jgi:hypothetical protein
MDRFSVAHVGCGLALHHIPRHLQADGAVEASLAFGAPGCIVVHHNVIAEKVRRLGAGVGDQGLGFGELQFEMLAQELSDSGLDLLSF